MSLFLRAVFGIKKGDFNGFFTNALDKEDAGVVLTKVFDKVLGTGRDGTGGTNKFGISSGNPKFGVLDATNAVKDYFANKGIKGDASNDITRLRALISDITGRSNAN